jgi:hypothetical protein
MAELRKYRRFCGDLNPTLKKAIAPFLTHPQLTKLVKQ